MAATATSSAGSGQANAMPLSMIAPPRIATAVPAVRKPVSSLSRNRRQSKSPAAIEGAPARTHQWRQRQCRGRMAAQAQEQTAGRDGGKGRQTEYPKQGVDLRFVQAVAAPQADDVGSHPKCVTDKWPGGESKQHEVRLTPAISRTEIVFSSVQHVPNLFKEKNNMPLYMDIHKKVDGATAKAVAEAHQKDLQVQDQYGVNYKKYWIDGAAGRSLPWSRRPTKKPPSEFTAKRTGW